MLRRTTPRLSVDVSDLQPDHLEFVSSHLPPVLGKDLDFYSQAGFDMEKIYLKRNAPVSLLYEDAIRNEGAIISSSGALINFSGKKTGRSPKDKRIVYEETSKDDIWWGSVNIKLDERKLSPRLNRNYGNETKSFLKDTFEINRERAIDYLNTRDNVYVFDGFAGVSTPLSLLAQDPEGADFQPVGPQVPDQGPRHLRSCISRAFHGTSASGS